MNELPSAIQKFILHWGEMGAKWGINRTVAQIHALLFTSEAPLHADDICEALGVARSNVSNSLKELQNWGVVKVVHLAGDRRDHFESMKDVYEMFRVILHERKKREIDPTVQLLSACVEEAKSPNAATPFAKQQMSSLLEMFELSADFYTKMNKVPTSVAVKTLKAGDKLIKALNLGSR